MTKKTATIANNAGIHVRPSGIIASELTKFKGIVHISRKNNSNEDNYRSSVCKTALDIIAMGLTKGEQIIIETEGAGEDATATILAVLFETEFDFPPKVADAGRT
ncbi:MAG: HPr family phosphocarrier protein [Spirochaetaceae bacterium]|nr:MAG: HPr family phosphocarrier protein [Spirochaetaceae bacterium]